MSSWSTACSREARDGQCPHGRHGSLRGVGGTQRGRLVLIEELHTDGWHIGGHPFTGPKSLMETLGRSKAVYETIDCHPTTRPEFAEKAPAKASGIAWRRLGVGPWADIGEAVRRDRTDVRMTRG